MGIWDRIKENDRRLREANRKELDRVDAKLAPYTNRKLNITTDDDTKPAVSRQMHITADPLPSRTSTRLSKPLRSPPPLTAADIANRNRRAAEKENQTPKPAPAKPRDEVEMGTSSAPKTVKPDVVKKTPQATPTVSKPSTTPKPTNYSKRAMDILGGSDPGALDEDNAVMKKLRERSNMSAKERDEAPKFESKYAEKLNKALGFKKGGHVKANGIARKGKTRGRII